MIITSSISVPSIAGHVSGTMSCQGSEKAVIAIHGFGNTDFRGGKWQVEVQMPGVSLYIKWAEFTEPCIIELPYLCGTAQFRCLIEPSESISVGAVLNIN